jgi:hypothetical protein
MRSLGALRSAATGLAPVADDATRFRKVSFSRQGHSLSRQYEVEAKVKISVGAWLGLLELADQAGLHGEHGIIGEIGAVRIVYLRNKGAVSVFEQHGCVLDAKDDDP